jgi:hypothetical protein
MCTRGRVRSPNCTATVTTKAAVLISAPVGTPVLLFAENNPCFGQIVGRQFDRDLVSRHNANEMLAHFAGDVSQDVALTGQIDAKHRAR